MEKMSKYKGVKIVSNVPSLLVKIYENNEKTKKYVYQASEHASEYAYWSQLLVTTASPQPPKPLSLKKLNAFNNDSNNCIIALSVIQQSKGGVIFI
jgi:hypothetical protein